MRKPSELRPEEPVEIMLALLCGRSTARASTVLPVVFPAAAPGQAALLPGCIEDLDQRASRGAHRGQVIELA